jgi:inorganic triphosphatase YgiF
MVGVSRELELKFALTREQLARLNADPVLKLLRQGKPKTRTLHSIYFDTPDFRLHDAGYTLRLRRVGRTWRQTVKSGVGVHGGVSHPVEIETVVKADRIDLEQIQDKRVRVGLRQLLGDSQLSPVFETVVQRTEHQLKTAEGCAAELALDNGVIRAGASEMPVCEAEMELKAGPPQGLLPLVSKLFTGERLKLAGESKAEAGYRLLGKLVDEPLQPLKARLPEFARDSCAGDALLKAVATAVEQILHNWQVVLDSPDPEGPHQMRVGLRRLRSLLQVFKPVVKKAELPDFAGRSRNLSDLVSRLREADVLIDGLIGPLDAEGGKHTPVKPLINVMSTARETARADLRSTLGAPEQMQAQLEIALLPAFLAESVADTRAAQRPMKKLARKALAKSWRKVEERAVGIDRLTEEERHELRKRLKMLRYAVEFVSPLYPEKKVARFLTRLEHLQDLFGYMNDVFEVRKLAGMSPDPAWEKPEVQRAIGLVIGWHTAHAEDAWHNARRIWKELKSTPRFWE